MGQRQGCCGLHSKTPSQKSKNKTKEQNEQISQPRFLVSDFFDSYPRHQLPPHTDLPDGVQGILPENQVPKMTITRTEIPWGKHAKANYSILDLNDSMAVWELSTPHRMSSLRKAVYLLTSKPEGRD